MFDVPRKKITKLSIQVKNRRVPVTVVRGNSQQIERIRVKHQEWAQRELSWKIKLSMLVSTN